MYTLIFVLVSLGCFAIGFLSDGILGMVAIFLCLASFIAGGGMYAEIVKSKSINGELLSYKSKLYEIKYVKDEIKE